MTDPSTSQAPISTPPNPRPDGIMTTQAIRLRPGEDLKQALEALARHHQWTAACVLACVGSLTHTALRYAAQSETTHLHGHFEIVSLSGTFSHLGIHLHMAVSDGTGHTVGGHVKEGCLVYTTVELVIGLLPELNFERALDPLTGYPELHITPCIG